MKHLRLFTFVALGLLMIAISPVVLQRWEASRLLRQIADMETLGGFPCLPAMVRGQRSWPAPHATGLGARGEAGAEVTVPTWCNAGSLATPDPALLVRVEEQSGLVASWQTVGGCGAGAGGGSSIGLKWIGRSVHGGLFNVQEQISYTKIGAPGYPEYNFFFNTLINTDLGEKWNVGVNLPFAYKYLVDPTHIGGPGVAPVDYSNAGLGDVGLLCTRKLGRINALALTGIVGLPTGVYDVRFTPGGTPLNQSQQIGFGRPTATLSLDQNLDKVWGLAVLGYLASWRGGTNKIHNYRAPSVTGYGYVGYFLGPLVPAIGVSVTEFTDHDRDQDAIMRTPLFSIATNLSLEWSSDWIALLIAASIPYGYDGINTNESGLPRSPWGFLPWTVSLGIAASPF